MKPILLSFLLALIFASCTTAYKSGQTPDDVYYSPERPRASEEYVRVDDDRNSKKYRHYDEESYDDRYVRMKVRNRLMWSELDYYYNDPYAYNYNRNRYYYNTSYNPYTTWNCYYNPYYIPYYSNGIFVNSKNHTYNKPRTYNLHVFDTPGSNNPKSTGVNRDRRIFDSDNRSYNTPRNSGADLRNVFGGSSNNSNSGSSSNSPSRSTESSGKSSSSSGSDSKSSSGGNAPVRKF
jgi:hypothetical protein